MVKPRLPKYRRGRRLLPVLLLSFVGAVLLNAYLHFGDEDDYDWIGIDEKEPTLMEHHEPGGGDNDGPPDLGHVLWEQSGQPRDNLKAKAEKNSGTKKKKSKSLLPLLRRHTKGIYLPHGTKGLTSIRLIGERHSGTNWATSVLLDCFPTVNVHNTLVNQKHWMQHTPEHILKMVHTYGNKTEGLKSARVQYGSQYTYDEIAKSPDPRSVFNRTFVVAIFRDPYDWMDAMRQTPHHWPNHQEYDRSPAFEKLVRERLSTNTRNGKFLNIRGNQANVRDALIQKRKKRQLPDMRSKQFAQNNLRRSKLELLRTQLSFNVTDGGQEQVDQRRLDQQEVPVENAGDPEESDQEDTGDLSPEELRKEEKDGLDDNSGAILLPWRDFVKSEMTIGMARPPGLHPRVALRIIKGSPSEPVYELKSDGAPYAHPLEFRAAKIKNFLDLPDKWELGGFLPIQYEDLKQRGTQFLLDAISKEFGVKPKCEPNPPDTDRGNHELDVEFEQWITNHADWETEAKLGYKPRTR